MTTKMSRSQRRDQKNDRGFKITMGGCVEFDRILHTVKHLFGESG